MRAPLRPDHESTIGGAMVVGMMLAFVIVAWLSSGCGSVTHDLKPIPVTITTPVLVKIENARKSCYLEEMPTPPEEIQHTLTEDDVIRRVFVHIRQYNEMVQFAHDMTIWGGRIAECIGILTEEP